MINQLRRQQAQLTVLNMDFPAVGHVYEARFDNGSAFHLRFESDEAMKRTSISTGKSETFAIEVTKICDVAFMISWQEGDGTTVVHVEDYDNETVYAAITQPDSTFERLKGTLKLVE